MSGQDYKNKGSKMTTEGAETKVFSMDYGTGQEQNISTAVECVDSPDGRKAWRILFFAVILTSLKRTFIVLQSTLLSMESTNNSSSGLGGYGHQLSVEAQTVVNTYNALYSVSGILSGILTVLAGYRWMALIGSGMTALGYLGAAFFDISNVHLIAFLYGAVPGIGHNLIEVAILTAILQYFSKRRLLALLIPNGGSALGYVAGISMAMFFTGFPGINKWKSFLLVQAGVACVMVPCSFFLRPLNARVKRQVNQSLLSFLMNNEELKVFRSILLYVFMAVCCLWDGGIGVIEAKIMSFKDRWWYLTIGQLLLSIIAAASGVGTCFSCCISSNIRLRSVVIAMAVFSGILFLLNMMASLLYNFIYSISYSVFVGVLKGLGTPLLEYLMPLLLGENNAAIGAAIMSCGQGIGTLSMPAIANEIERSTQKVDGCFYFAGGIFFLSASFIILTYWFHLRVTKQVASSNGPEEKPNEEQERTWTDRERF